MSASRQMVVAEGRDHWAHSLHLWGSNRRWDCGTPNDKHHAQQWQGLDCPTNQLCCRSQRPTRCPNPHGVSSLPMTVTQEHRTLRPWTTMLDIKEQMYRASSGRQILASSSRGHAWSQGRPAGPCNRPASCLPIRVSC